MNRTEDFNGSDGVPAPLARGKGTVMQGDPCGWDTNVPGTGSGNALDPIPGGNFFVSHQLDDALGAQYQATEQLLWNVGVTYDSSAVSDSNRTVTGPWPNPGALRQEPPML